MRWLTKDDLQAHAQGRAIQESGADWESTELDLLDVLEAQNIDVIKSYLSSYNADELFNNTTERPQIIVMVLATLVLYNLVKRNTYRKVPDDMKERYQWAMEWLQNVQRGLVTVPGLIEKDSEKSAFDLRYGTNTNKDWQL